MTEPSTFTCPDGETIAYYARPGNGAGAEKTGVVWLGGLASDMDGTKATALDDWAQAQARGYVRFDYFGHGRSSGAFVDGTISRWSDDAVTVLDHLTSGPQILVGSSMGGWAAILAALSRPERVAGLVFVAPAPDFTEDLMWAEFSDEVKAKLTAGEIYEQPSMYDDNPYLISPRLIEDGRNNLVLRDPIAITCPVRILHGMKDVDVPWQRSLLLIDQLESDDVTVTFVKDADHRISDDHNIARLIKMVDGLCCQVDG